MTIDPRVIEIAARAAHEANRAYCLSMGDTSVPTWEHTSEHAKESLREGVQGVIRGATPEQSHEGWMLFKLNAGWRHGPVKDAFAKTHPCLVPYDQLPEEQRAKDELFIGIVKAILSLHGNDILVRPAEELCPHGTAEELCAACVPGEGTPVDQGETQTPAVETQSDPIPVEETDISKDTPEVKPEETKEVPPTSEPEKVDTETDTKADAPTAEVEVKS